MTETNIQICVFGLILTEIIYDDYFIMQVNFQIHKF
jgi:hypothetical protein